MPALIDDLKLEWQGKAVTASHVHHKIRIDICNVLTQGLAG